jgi:hypothetical protein
MCAMILFKKELSHHAPAAVNSTHRTSPVIIDYINIAGNAGERVSELPKMCFAFAN